MDRSATSNIITNYGTHCGVHPMGLTLAMKEGDAVVLTLPDGREVKIIHTKRDRPARGMVVHIKAPADIRISREPRQL